MINIFRIIKGVETTVCRVADSNASVVNEIMGREEITVNTTVESPLPVEVGDYVRLDGTVYTLNREPDFEKTSDVEYHYNLLFESPLYRLLDKLFTNPLTGVSKFSVARTLAEFVRFITENMNKIDSGWAVSKDIPASEPKNLSFEAVSCRDVLNMLSGEFSAEYFLDGKIICFKERIENKTNLVFEQGKGKGLYSISQEPVDSENTVTRIYPYGSTQNMLPGKGDVNGRLFLPEGYLENFSEYNKVVEKEVEFNDVYPRFTGVVDTVSGQDNLVLKCASVNFDVAAQAIGGVPVKINFLSGNLMGESFEFGWDNPTKTITLKLKEDENAQADKDGKKPLIPHALKKVVAGDSFNFTDLKMPETPYLTSAIAELRAKATDWLAYYSRSRVKFTLQVDHRYLRGKRVLRAGDLITIRFPETGVDKLLRIVSTERSLSTGKITCTVSNYLDEKWEKKIEGAISSLKSSVSSSTAGGLTINIIKEEDITPASDRNVYSALRSSGEFLNKTHADTATAPLTFARGLTATDGILTDTLNVTDRATVASLDVAGTAVAEVLNVSVEATAASLGVTGNTATGSLNVSGNTTSVSLDVANNISAGSLDVSSLAKAGSIDVEDLARTKMLQVSGLAKAGNIEVANNAKTKDLEVSELARIRDLVVTRLAEVLNLSVTDTATLAKTIVKESIGTGTFIPGFTGEGFKIWKLAAGWNLEIDTLTIRKTLTAFELLISKIRSVNGALAITQGNGKIKNVLDQTTVYAIEIEDTMSFVSGDLVRCQTWQSAGSKYYWVTVTRVEGNSIICNKSEFNGIVPAAGDELVQMGNVSNTARQSMIYLDASSGRPSIDVLSGINTKSFDNKLKVRLGCLDGITDTDFPSNMQPSGDGIYCTNGFFKGMFVLRSGKTVEDYTGEAVDAIQIGGANLLSDSAKERTSRVEYVGFAITDVVANNLGKTVTISADVKVSVAGDVNFYSLGSYKVGFNKVFNITEANKYVRIHATGKFSYTAGGEGDVCTLSFYGTYGTGIIPTVKNIKIEEGNKATAWTPALEDVDAAIKDAQDAADTANSAVERIDTELLVLPETITAAVTKTTTEYTDNKIAGIQIGGRNLIKNSKTILSSISDNPYTLSVMPLGEPIKSNTTYTISVEKTDIVIGEATNFFTVITYSASINKDYTNIKIPISQNKQQGQFTTPEIPEGCVLLLYSGLVGNAQNRQLRWTNLKLEEGNQATAWTPAPEDSAAALEVVRTELDTRLTITEKGIEQKASKEEFNALGQRVGTAEASIKTQADKIALTVTKEEFNNLQVSGRNLFRESGNFTETPPAIYWGDNGGGYVIDTAVTFGGYNTIRTMVGAGMVGAWYKLENGVEYTYSAMIHSSIDVIGLPNTPLHYWAGKDSVSQGGLRVVKYDTSLIAGVWKLVYVTFKLINDSNSFLPFIYQNGKPAIFNVAFLCLTKGNVPMINWVPAVEDTDAVISKQEARIKLTEEGITSQASSISGLTNRMQTAEQNITPESITQTVRSNVKVGSRNYLRGSRIDNLENWFACGGTANLVSDDKMGTVVEYSRPGGGGDFEKVFTIPHAELTNTDLVYFVIAKEISVGGVWSFGGWSATVGGVASNADKIDLGNGWYQYWRTFKSGDTIGTTFGINTIGGTWRFYAAGVLKGTAPTDWTPAPEDRPTFDEIESEFQQTANGFRLRGKEISLQGKVTFSMLASDSQSTINGKATPTDISNAVKDYNNTIIEGGHIKTGLIEGATLNFTKGTIGGFNITANSLYAGGLYPNPGIEMVRTAEAGRFLAGRGVNDYCMLYNYNANQWGIEGAAGGVRVFHLGSHNQIAGWTFDNEAIFTGEKAAPDAFSTGGVTLRSNGSFLSKNFMITANGDVFGNDCTFNNGRFTGNLNIEGNVTAAIRFSNEDGDSCIRLGLSGINMFDSAFLTIRDTSASNIGLYINNQTDDEYSLDCRAITSYGNHRFFGNKKESFIVSGPSNFMQVLFSGFILSNGSFLYEYTWWNREKFAFACPFISSAKTGTGTYTIRHNLGHAKYAVLIIPIGPAYGSVTAYSPSGFVVRTADDATPNDCGFHFFVIDMNPFASIQ